MFKRAAASNQYKKEDPTQDHNGQTEQECLIQANLGDQGTILLIAGIVTIWIPVTSRCLEDTPFGAIKSTRPPMRVLSFWEKSIALAIAEGIFHVAAVLTQVVILGAACKVPLNATVIVACKECFTLMLTPML